MQKEMESNRNGKYAVNLNACRLYKAMMSCWT